MLEALRMLFSFKLMLKDFNNVKKVISKSSTKETHDGPEPFSAKEHQEESTNIDLISSSSHPSE